ncbi:MAG: TIGR03905 family TSCPD domain-containing protein [Firmicutes bacterium]|nr:TIGR03905 family TSCPD domain-containing protein [Bacillota bacterium]
MKQQIFKTKGTCASMISFRVDDEGCIHDILFTGGCDGNLKAIGLLAEGKPASEVADILTGNVCGFKKTSCADQLSQAIRQAGY